MLEPSLLFVLSAVLESLPSEQDTTRQRVNEARCLRVSEQTSKLHFVISGQIVRTL